MSTRDPTASCPTNPRQVRGPRPFQFPFRVVLGLVTLICACAAGVHWGTAQDPLEFLGRCGLLAVLHLLIMWALLGPPHKHAGQS